MLPSQRMASVIPVGALLTVLACGSVHTAPQTSDHETRQRISQSSNPEELRRYLQWSAAPHKAEAQERPRELDEAAWADADALDTVDAYTRYLMRFSDGHHVQEARTRRLRLAEQQPRSRPTEPKSTTSVRTETGVSFIPGDNSVTVSGLWHEPRIISVKGEGPNAFSGCFPGPMYTGTRCYTIIVSGVERDSVGAIVRFKATLGERKPGSQDVTATKVYAYPPENSKALGKGRK